VNEPPAPTVPALPNAPGEPWAPLAGSAAGPGSPIGPAGTAATSAPRRNWLVSLIGIVLVVTLAGVGVVQWRQFQVLNHSVQYQGDYLLIGLNQLETEFLRMRSELIEAAQNPEARQRLPLRYEIFVSRVKLLGTRSAARLIADPADFDHALGELQAFVRHADEYLGPRPTAVLDVPAMRALRSRLDELGGPVHALALEASHHVASQVELRNRVVREHNRTTIGLIVLLSVSTLGLALASMRQRRELEGRRLGLERLAANLRIAQGQAEAASQSKSAFLANMSHEIRTPFHGLLGMLALLRDSPLDARQEDYLRTASESADHLLVILNDILDMSKLESGSLGLTPEDVSLGRLVADIETLMRPQALAKGLALRAAVAPNLPERIHADPTRVKQVLFNLVSNAIKFSDAGSVTLSARPRPGGAVIDFNVTDTGIGMDEAMLARLFQRFTQGDESRSRRFGGTGLGLEISRNLARLMGGDIKVRSTPGQGSSFSFWLPLVTAKGPSGPVAAATLQAGPTRPLWVLVAEDHEVNRKYMGALLARMGHRAHFVQDGAQAVQALQRAATPFDIVLMDMHMPVMDGVAAATAIRALPGPAGAVPIITLTADAFAESRERCLAAGMNDFLAKPVDPQALAAMFCRYFEPLAAAVPAQAQIQGPSQAAVREPATAATPAPTPESSLLPPSSASAGALLDHDVINNVLSLLPRQRFVDLAEGFLNDGTALVARLQHALGDDRMDELRAAAHATKGVALNLGLSALAAAAEQVQVAARAASPHGAADAIERYAALLPTSRQALRGAYQVDPGAAMRVPAADAAP
jgi:signal transduction histidine kinase/CheY-like chemotaxis protein